MVYNFRLYLDGLDIFRWVMYIQGHGPGDQQVHITHPLIHPTPMRRLMGPKGQDQEAQLKGIWTCMVADSQHCGLF